MAKKKLINIGGGSRKQWRCYDGTGPNPQPDYNDDDDDSTMNDDDEKKDNKNTSPRWTCHACTFENLSYRMNCEICYAPKNQRVFTTPHAPSSNASPPNESEAQQQFVSSHGPSYNFNSNVSNVNIRNIFTSKGSQQNGDE